MNIQLLDYLSNRITDLHRQYGHLVGVRFLFVGPSLDDIVFDKPVQLHLGILSSYGRQALLLALGCTRFSITGCDISKSQALENDIAAFLRAKLDGCAISYLAVQGHIGWLDALARIPWQFMIYEGHEGESREDFHRHISQLQEMVDCRINSFMSYADGDSEKRTLAIVLRS